MTEPKIEKRDHTTALNHLPPADVTSLYALWQGAASYYKCVERCGRHEAALYSPDES